MSGSFTDKMRDLAGKIAQGLIVTETELERNFLNIIEEELQARGVTPTVEQQRRVLRGRTDARIGGLVFEFKKPKQSKPNLQAAKKQIENYIDEYKQQGILLRGIVTDGIEIIFVDEEKQVIEEGIFQDDLHILEMWVSALSLKAVSPTELVSYLGPTSSVGKALIKEFFDSYMDHKQDVFLKECFDLWDSVYGCATNLNEKSIESVKDFARNSLNIHLATVDDVKDFLFVLQTFLSILMKLLVAEVAIQKSVILAASVEEVLGKYVIISYEKLSERIPFLSRVFEYDTFYWFATLSKLFPEIDRMISDSLLQLAKILDSMDFSSVSTDLVKRMYQGFFNSETRKALGEFYTPDALVDQVLDCVDYKNDVILDSIALDPACGSGTFLVRAIDRFINIANSKNLPKSESLKKITEQIIGFDIHPFAVAMAKVNYLLSLGRLIDPSVKSKLQSLPIPIYWVDSLARAGEKTEFGGKLSTSAFFRVVEIKVPVLGSFKFPDPNDIDFDRLIDVTQLALENNLSDDNFLANFPSDKRLTYKDLLIDLLHTFQIRKAQGLNGKWLSTLRNFIIVDKLRGRCNFVIGNPPWVRIHNVNELIRKELTETFRVYRKDKKHNKAVGWNPKLQNTVVPFPQQVDYCMAFLEAGLSYSRDEGKIGFVITAKIMNALYANLLREMLLKETEIMEIRDYSLSDEQFFEEATNYPMILALRKTAHTKTTTRARIMMKGAKQLDWELDQKRLPILPRDLESPWCVAPPNIIEIFRTMQKSNPRLGDKYSIQMGVKTSVNDIYLIRDFMPTATEGVVQITNKGDENANLEEELLRPVIRGRDIKAWDFNVSGYIAWTHDDVTGIARNIIPKNAMDYFNRNQKKLQSRADYKKGQPIWTIFRVSKDKLKSKVGWGELSRTMEVVFIPENLSDERLGNRKLIAIQTVYFISTGNEELNYILAAILNSTPVRGFLASFAERARGRYFRHISWTVGLIPLPKVISDGNTHNPQVVRIAELSRKMHELKGTDTALSKELDNIIIELYGLSAKNLSTLQDYLQACGVPTFAL